MKKLTIAIATLFVAVFANAATVNWSAASIKADPIGTAVTSYTAYLIDNTTFAQSTVTTENLASAIAASIGTASIVETSATNPDGKIAVTKVTDSYAAGASATYYMIVLDADTLDTAKWYQVSATKTGTVTSAGVLQMALGTQAGNTWTQAGAVPEPTTGLLLLLGMAGLALKRKHV